MTLRAALRAQLSNAFSGRVYAGELPDNVAHLAGAFPAATISQISREDTYSHDGASGYSEFRIQITVWAKSHDGAVTKAAEVRELIDGFRGTMASLATVESCFMTGEDVDLSEPGDGRGLWIIRQDYTISALDAVDPDVPAGQVASSSSARVDRSLRSALMLSVSVGTLVGNRVYITRSPDNRLPAAAELPAVVLHQMSRVPHYSHDGAIGYTDVRMTVHSWAQTSDAARTLADAIRTEIEGYRGAMPAVGSTDLQITVESCFLDDEDEDLDDPGDGRSLHLVRQDFLLSVLEDIVS